MNRSADWLHQAHADLDQALVSAKAGHSPVTQIAFRMGPSPTISVVCKATTLFAMPVRSLTQSVMRWPEPDQVMRQVKAWTGEQAARVQSLERVAVFGSYGRGTAGVGSDLDLLLIDAHASGPQHERLLRCPLELLPLSCDALVLTPSEHEALMAAGSRFATELRRDARWVWSRPLTLPADPCDGG